MLFFKVPHDNVSERSVYIYIYIDLKGVLQQRKHLKENSQKGKYLGEDKLR